MESLFLRLQAGVDRWSRWMRLAPTAASEPRRRFLIVQIDGLSRGILDRALAGGARNATAAATGRLERRELGRLPSFTPASRRRSCTACPHQAFTTTKAEGLERFS
jgi:hypothetical protein